MNKLLKEQPLLFASILKWVLLATGIGIVVGASTSLFLSGLRSANLFTSSYQYYYFALPVALFISIALTKYLAPDAEGHGTEKVIEAVHKKSGKINIMVVPVKLVATIITIAFGGSVGKEGPCAQIGGGLSSFLADLFRFSPADRRKLVICGISAGFASVFGTPIAGAIFGVEVLFVGAILYDVMLPSFIAGIISYHVTTLMKITYFYHPITVVPVFTNVFFLEVLLSGLCFGITSVILVQAVKYGERLGKLFTFWKPLRGLVGGAALVGLTFIAGTRFLGLGITNIESSLNGTQASWYDPLMKIVFTAITLGFGGSGGIITPIFFVGASTGSFFGQVFGLDPSTFAAIGFVALLAGCANTPISASILSVEMFGPQIAPYATIACVISFLLSGHNSVYPSQVLSVSKSTNVRVELGKEIEDTEVELKPRLKSVGRLGRRVMSNMGRKGKK